MESLEPRQLLATFLVTSTADSGPGTLRQAMADANATGAPSTIEFNIPPQDPGHVYYRDDGVAGRVTLDNVAATTAADDESITDIDPDWPHSWYTIRPATPMPAVTYPMTFDGYTQPGATPNRSADAFDGVLRIELDGTNIDGGFRTRGDNTFRGLVINRIGRPFITGGYALDFTRGNNVVTGNILGADVSGTLALGMANHAVYVNSDNNQIGGTLPADRNLISGNRLTGIWIENYADGNVIQGNLIGTAADGVSPLGNGGTGIHVNSGAGASVKNTRIGGPETGAGNVIAFNNGSGINVGATIEDLLIQGNRIESNAGEGVSARGDQVRILDNVVSGNAGHGISSVGSRQVIASNTIRDNAGSGVALSSSATEIAVLSNAVFSNRALGIDLSGGTEDSFGVTANDTLDADTGANDLQNFPLVTSVTRIAEGTSVRGVLESTPDTDFRLQFFSSSEVDPSGYGEGAVFLGEADVRTDAAGLVSFAETITGSVPAGHFVTATATRLADVGGVLQPVATSEFSPPNENPVAGAIRWDGGGDGVSWSDPLNWAGDLLPGPNEDVLIDVADADPEIVFDSGVVLVGSLISNEPFRLEGGTLATSGDSRFNAAFTLTGSGTLSGDGSVTTTGLFTWSGGTMSGAGTTISTGTWNISGDAPKFVADTRQLVNEGTLVWSGGGEVFRGTSAPTFTNAAGATFSIETDSDFFSGPVLGGAFLNDGTLQKRLGAGTASIKVPFINQGTVAASSGTLRFAFGFSQLSGTTSLASAKIESPQQVRIDGGVLAGTGRVIADVRNGGTVRPGEIDQIGTLAIDGDWTQTADGILEIDLSGAPANDLLRVSGNATLGGTLRAVVPPNAVPRLGTSFEILTFGSSRGEFVETEGFNYASGKLEVETGTSKLSLVFTEGINVPLVSGQLADGLSAIEDNLQQWFSSFDLGGFAAAGLPVPQIAGLDRNLATLFSLPSKSLSIDLPAVTPAGTLAQLENQLDALKEAPWSITVECLAGETVDETPCAAGDFLQLRFEQRLSDLTALPAWDAATATGILQGLTDAVDLTGTLDLNGEATLVVVVGVDETGFYLDSDSELSLNFAGSGGVGDDSATIAGVATSVSGSATVDVQLTLSPHSGSRRHRIGAVTGSPQSLFLPSASGETVVDLTATIGPAGLEWQSRFDVGVDAVPQNSLAAELELTGWQDHSDDEAAPALFRLEGTLLDDGSWDLSGQGEGDFGVPGGVIDIRDPWFGVKLTETRFAGTTNADLRVLPDNAALTRTIAFSLGGSITADRIEWTGTGNLRPLGLLHAASNAPLIELGPELASVGLSASVGIDIAAAAPFGSIEITTTEADVLAGQPVSGELKTVTATLDSGGRISVTAAELGVDIGKAFRLSSENVELVIDSAAPAGAPFLTLGETVVALPAMERSGLLPTLTVDGFGFRNDGRAFIGDPSSGAGDAVFDVVLPESYPDTYGLAGIVPVKIDGITVTFPENDITHPTATVQGTLDLPSDLFGPGSVAVVTIQDEAGNDVSTSGQFTVPLSVDGLAVGEVRAARLGEVKVDLSNVAIGGITADVGITVANLDAAGESTQVSGTATVTAGDAVFGTGLSVDLDGVLDFEGDQATVVVQGVAETGGSDVNARAVFDGTVTAGLGAGSAAADEFGVETVWELIEGQAGANIDFTISDVLRLTGNVTVTSGADTLLTDARIEFLGSLDDLPAVDVEGVVVQSGGSVYIASATMELGDVALGTFASFEGLNITIADLGLSFDTDGQVIVSGDAALTVEADAAAVLPGNTIFATTLTSPSGSVDVLGSSAGTLRLGASQLTVDVVGTGVILRTDSPQFILPANVGSGQEILTAVSASITLPLLDGKEIELSAQDIALTEAGRFSLASASLVAKDGLSDALGIAGVLPFDVTSVTLNPLDSESSVLLNKFEIVLQGDFSFGVLESWLGALPGTPVLNIGGNRNDDNDTSQFTVSGGDQLSAGGSNDDYSITFSIDTSRTQAIQIEDLGPIFIGLQEMEFGPMTADAWIELGGYQNGQFSGDFAASVDLDFQTAAADIQGGLLVTGSLDLTSPSQAVLDVGITLTSGFQSDNVPVEFRGLELSFETALTVDRESFAVVAEPPSLTGLSVEELRVSVFDVLDLVATEAAIGLDPSLPFLMFGGDADTATGALALEFGSSTPLEGLGGAMGNFGVGFTPEDGFQFYFLDGFFVKVFAPDDFNFGLPDWLPFSVREIGVQFNQSPENIVGGIWDGTTEAGDLADVRLLFSGGLQGTEILPITAQVEDMIIDIPKLVACMESYVAAAGSDTTVDGYWSTFGTHVVQNCSGDQNPIENLDAVEFGVEEITLGPITIGGVLGLGTIDVPLDADDPAGPTRDVWYGRIMGQFAYADSGIGIELVLTEYGPVLARIFAGVPIPIGALVGALIGTAFPGIGTAAGANVGKQTGFILTGLEGGLIFGGDRLPVVEEPIEILESDLFHDPFSISIDKVVQAVGDSVRASLADPNNPTYTWSEGFTFAGSGVLTNEYVAGMIGARLTLGANVGYADQVGAQLFGIGDVEIVGLDLASVGVLFDYRQPSEPTFNMAFSLPGTPGNPLSLVLPVQGQLGARIETTGISEAAALATRKMLQEIHAAIIDTASAGVEIGQDFLASLFDVLARTIEARRKAVLDSAVLADTRDAQADQVRRPLSPFARVILDQNLDGDLLLDELQSVAITPQTLLTRLIELTGAGLSGDVIAATEVTDALMEELLDVGGSILTFAGAAASERQSLTTEYLVELGVEATAELVSSLIESTQEIVDELSDPAVIELLAPFAKQLLPEDFALEAFDPALALGQVSGATLGYTQARIDNTLTILSVLRKTIQDRMASAIEETGDQLWEIIDPSLTIEGALVPTVLGIPVADPVAEGSLRLDKQGLTVDIDTTLAALSAPFAVHPFSAAALAAIISLGSDPSIGMSMSLPVGNVVGEILLPGIDAPNPDQEPGDPAAFDQFLDPFDQDWGIELRTSFRVFHFETALFKGLAVVPPLAGPRDELNEFAENRIQKMWDDPDAEIDPDRIPIFDADHYQSLLDYGGILLNGLVRVPEIITDPAEFFAREDLQLAEDPGAFDYLQWSQALVGALDDADTPGLFQIFLPSYQQAIEIDLVADPSQQGSLPVGDCVVPTSSQNGVRFDSPPVPPDACRIHLVNPDVVDEISRAAYFEGAWGAFTDPAGNLTEAKILGIPVGKGRVSWTQDGGLQLAFPEPILNKEVTAVFDSREIDPPAGTNRSSPNLLPRAAIDISLSTDELATALENLGLPLAAIQPVDDPAPGASAYYRAYSPGFSETAGTDPLQLEGGVEFGGRISLPPLLESEMAFQYSMGVSPATGLPELQSFSGSGIVDSFSPIGPAAPSEVLSFQDVFLELTHDGALAPEIRLGGTLTLVGHSFTFDSEDGISFLQNGIVGSIKLNPEFAGGFSIGPDGYELDLDAAANVEFSLEVDTRPGQKSFIRIAGDAMLGGFQLTESTFEFGVDSEGRLSISTSGNLRLPGLGDFTIQQGSLLVSPLAFDLAASLRLQHATPAEIDSIFSVSGEFDFAMNSFDESTVLEGRSIPAATVAHFAGNATVEIPPVSLELEGALGFSIGSSGVTATVGAGGLDVRKLFGVATNDLPDWLFPSGTQLRIDSGNFALADDGTVEFNNMQLFDLDGSVDLLAGRIAMSVDLTLDGTLSDPLGLLTGDVSGALTWLIPGPDGELGPVLIGAVDGSLDGNGCLTASIDTQFFDSSESLALVPGACEPHLTISGSSALESESFSKVRLQLSRPLEEELTVSYSIETVSGALGDLRPADEADFVVETGTVTIPRGETRADINVRIVDDDDIEFDEILQVRIVEVTPLTRDFLNNDTALVVIANDDRLEAFPQVSATPFLAYDFEIEHEYSKVLPQEIPEYVPDTDSKADGTPVDNQRVVQQGLSQFVGDDDIPLRAEVRSFGYELNPTGDSNDSFEFTVNLPSQTVFEKLQFWSSPIGGNEGATEAEFDVFWSIDDFNQPLSTLATFQIDNDLFGEDFAEVLEDGGIAEGLLGWLKNETQIDTAATNLLCASAGDVTFRIQGRQSDTVYLDNVELFAHTANPLDNCFGNEIDDVVTGRIIELLDPVYGDVLLELNGPGSIDVIHRRPLPVDGVTDPIATGQVVSISLTGTTSESQLRIGVENTRVSRPLSLSQLTSDGPLGSFFARNVASLAGNFEFASLDSFIGRGLESGSSLLIGGSSTGVSSLMLFGNVGDVDLSGPGTFDIASRSWSGGRWTVGELDDALVTNGDLGASISIARGFDTIEAIGGDLSGRLLETGTGPEAGDGGGGVIRARSDADGEGGSILVGQIRVDGDLDQIAAEGGDLRASITANSIGTISSTSLDGPLGGGDIAGTMVVTALNSLSSYGGDITAYLKTLDPKHSPLSVTAEPDSLGRGGRIDSPHSFLIAGAIDRIAAHQIRLHLEADQDVESIEVLPRGSSPGSLEGSFSAKRFGTIQGEVEKASFNLFARQADPGTTKRTSLLVTNRNGGNGEGENHRPNVLMIDIREPVGVLQVAFDERDPDNMVPLELGTMEAVIVPADRPGARIAKLAESLTGPFEVSDSRFTVGGGFLALRSDQQLTVVDAGLTVAVSEAASTRRRQTFLIDVTDAATNPWQNSVLPADVNGDGQVTPRDVLLVIDALSSGNSGELPVPPPNPHDFLDVTGDTILSPADALAVVDYLNRPANGEGESAWPELADTVLTDWDRYDGTMVRDETSGAKRRTW